MVACLASLLALSGCAQQRIEQGMNAYVGKPASALIARLSYPDGRSTVGGRRTYIWSSEEAAGGSIFSSSHVDSVGSRPITLVSNAMTMSPVDHRCEIRVEVDAEDRVVAWDSRGNEGGCAPYARRLAAR